MDPDISTTQQQGGGEPSTTPNAGGEPGTSWLSSLPQELQSSKSLQKFSSVEALAKSYINAEGLIGRDKIPMPKTDEEFMAVYDRLGRPSSPEGYGFTLDGVEDEQLRGLLEKDLEWFGPKAHELGLSKKQAQALMEAYVGKVGEVRQASNSNVDYEFNRAQAALRQEFGKEGADDRIRVANLTLSKFLSRDVINMIENSGLGRSAEFIKFLASVGDDRLEELGIDRTGNNVLTPESLMDEISRAQADPAYMDKTHPGHKAAVAKVTSLYEKMAGIR